METGLQLQTQKIIKFVFVTYGINFLENYAQKSLKEDYKMQYFGGDNSGLRGCGTAAYCSVERIMCAVK
jgi:hypothetical protein